MNSIIYAAIIGVLMILAVAAALKLFDINSDFSPIIRKVSIPAAIVITLIMSIYSVPSIVSEEKYSGGVFALIVAASFILVAIIGWIMSKVIDKFVNKKPQGKKKKEDLPFAPLTAIDAIGGIIAGIAFSGYFFSSSICYFAAVALACFLIIEKTAIVFRYQNKWPRNKIIANIAISLFAIPVTAVIILLIVKINLNALNILLAFGTGYLLYRCAYHLFFIAKSMKKR